MGVRKSPETFKEEVYNLHGDEYVILTDYVDCKTKVKVRHNLDGCNHEYEVLPNNILRNRRCPKCSLIIKGIKGRNDKHKMNEIIKQYDEHNKFTQLTDYERYHKKFKIQCNDCGYKFSNSLSNISKYKKITCPCCGYGSKIINTETIHYYLKYVLRDEYELLSEYRKAKERVLLKHKKCGNQWWVTLDSFKSGTRCPICNESKGESTIRHFLEDNDIVFKAQYYFNDCIDKKKLPFDFAIFKDNKIKFIIEVDGEQHRVFKGCFYKTYDQFEDRLKKDSIKTNYCKDNNIKLYRIEYNKLKDIENWVKDNREIFKDL